MKNEESRMATMPVKKLMISMGIPMIISMMLQALYSDNTHCAFKFFVCGGKCGISRNFPGP